MQDIFEFSEFYNWYFFSKKSFFILVFLFIFYFLFSKILKKFKNKNNFIVEKIDFLKELDKIYEKKDFLKELFNLFIKFLEIKTKNFEISKMTFQDLQKIKLEKKFKTYFEEIYFLLYSKQEISENKKNELYLKFKNIFKNENI